MNSSQSAAVPNISDIKHVCTCTCTGACVLVAQNINGQILQLQVENEEVFVDDLTGQRLDATLVKAVCKLEVDYVKAKGLWLKRPTKECFE